jgi:hypothetical protein
MVVLRLTLEVLQVAAVLVQLVVIVLVMLQAVTAAQVLLHHIQVHQ